MSSRGAVLAVLALDRGRSCWTSPMRCSASGAGGDLDSSPALGERRLGAALE